MTNSKCPDKNLRFRHIFISVYSFGPIWSHVNQFWAILSYLELFLLLLFFAQYFLLYLPFFLFLLFFLCLLFYEKKYFGVKFFCSETFVWWKKFLVKYFSLLWNLFFVVLFLKIHLNKKILVKKKNLGEQFSSKKIFGEKEMLVKNIYRQKKF